MNTRPPLFKPVGPASLADEPDFALGPLSVRPSIREVSSGERRETLEPRLMQVLVVLAQADGAVVSRDELIRLCWGGRAISDDAINRAISKLRQLGNFDGREAFTIETIARVGYRLIRSKAEQKSASPTLPPLAVVPVSPPEAADAPTIAAQASQKSIPWRILSVVGATVIVIAVAITLSFYLFAPRAASFWIVAEAHQPFISGPGLAARPSISPNGGMIAYTEGPDADHSDLYVRMLSGGEARRLTTGDVAHSPVWSLDSGRIAYSSTPSDGVCNLMVIDTLGGTPRRVGRCGANADPGIAWSGNSLFYADSVRADAPSAIFRLALDSGEPIQVSYPTDPSDRGDILPTVSPDGKTLAFLRQINWGTPQIVVRDLASGKERVLLTSFDDEVSIAWSNDSTTLFIARNRRWDTALWAYPISGAAPQRITTSPIPLGHVSSGPNGLVAMQLEHIAGDLAVAPTTPDAPLTEFAQGYTSFFEAYAPDGTLAVIARESGAMSLFLAGSDKVLHELVQLKGDYAAAIAWSPDSTRLALIEGDGAQLSIDIVDRSGLLKRVPYSHQDSGWLEWSGDGKGLLVTAFDKQRWHALRLDPDRPDKFMPVPLDGWFNLRTHGSMIFGVNTKHNGIWRLDGPKPQKITDGPLITEDATGSDSWTIAGNDLVYLDTANAAHPLLKAQPMQGGPVRTIGYPQGMISNDILAVDPKTMRVTFQHRTTFESDIGWLRLTRK
ncbi:MAG TPA: winged helix-turn-helix domain-containing protein [Rhizomicrobium sp.]|jgi:Tol biopolymer transport system component/DNA-binding winged helix-turn-helix (wHTH) protein